MSIRLKRLAQGDIKTNGKYDDSYWAKGIRLPNCTLYSLLRLREEGLPQQALFTYSASVNSFPNAQLWYTYWRGQKGTTPKIGSVIVWGSASSKYGHVAICEDILEDNGDSWVIQVSQSNYGGTYFESKEYTIKKGVTTKGVGMPYIGCCYVDVPTGQATRNKTKHQIQVTGDMVRARKSANGDQISGMYIPKGYYDVKSTKKVNNDIWAQIDDEVWCGAYEDLPATEEAVDLSKYIVDRDTSTHQVEVINKIIKARKSPSLSGEEIGELVPVGIYNVKDTTEADNYTWVKLDTNVWFALVEGNYNDLPVDSTDYKKKYNEEVKLYKELQTKYASLESTNKELGTTIDNLKINVSTLEIKITNAKKALT